jgi:hypothetical protein
VGAAARCKKIAGFAPARQATAKKNTKQHASQLKKRKPGPTPFSFVATVPTRSENPTKATGCWILLEEGELESRTTSKRSNHKDRPQLQNVRGKIEKKE